MVRVHAARLTTPMPHAEAAHDTVAPCGRSCSRHLVHLSCRPGGSRAALRSPAPTASGGSTRAASALCHLHMLAAQQHSPQQASAWLQSLLAGALGSLQQEGHVANDVAQRL